MKKLLLFLPFIGLFNCQPKEQPSDVAARASATYTVQYYIVNGDTLYSINGINKVNVSNFYIVVDRKSPDSVRVGSFYTRAGFLPMVAIRDVGVSEMNGTFQLSAKTGTLSAYESSIDNNVFYERTVGSAIAVWLVDPSNSASYLPPKDVVIRAKK